MPEFHDGIAADAEETIPEKILTANCSAATWHSAFQVRKIDCIPYAAFKEATGDSVQVYKDTLRLLFQKHSPNSSRGRTGGSISAVQVETSLAGGHVGPQTDSESFVLLIDALRYFDACCLKVSSFTSTRVSPSLWALHAARLLLAPAAPAPPSGSRCLRPTLYLEHRTLS